MPEGEGTVLDNSCLLFLSNMWSGYKHDNTKLPVLTVGRLSGALEMQMNRFPIFLSSMFLSSPARCESLVVGAGVGLLKERRPPFPKAAASLVHVFPDLPRRLTARQFSPLAEALT
jgi:hypothetical protein